MSLDNLKNSVAGERDILDAYISIIKQSKTPKEIPLLLINAGYSESAVSPSKYNTYTIIESESLKEHVFIITNQYDCNDAIHTIRQLLNYK